MLYRYVKAAPGIRKRPRSPAVSYALMVGGGLVLFWALWPILSFVVINQPLLGKTVSPIGDTVGVGKAKYVPPAVFAAGAVEPISETGVDYTNPNVWFPTLPQKKVVTPVNSYTVSIPKLGIENATAIIGGDDLNKGLIHYGGTGLPGDYGNAVIFGHSTLPQFFSPTNYRSIFSTLPTMAEGDEILVTYDGVTYRYVVYDMVVTDPTDLSPLEQRFDDSYITLVTCVPPGTYWKRLNVRAKLSRI